MEVVPVTSGTQQPSSWAKWIRKIYETDPLTCSECGEPMRIIAFITDPREVVKILEHIGEQTLLAPPLMLTDPVPSFSDLGDTNFQYPEVPWYPDPPAPRSTIERGKGIYALSGPLCRFSEPSKAMEIPSKKERHQKPNTVKSNPSTLPQPQMPLES